MSNSDRFAFIALHNKLANTDKFQKEFMLSFETIEEYHNRQRKSAWKHLPVDDLQSPSVIRHSKRRAAPSNEIVAKWLKDYREKQK